MTKLRALGRIQLVGKGVTAGKKVQVENEPRISTDVAFNKLTINAKAASMMGLVDGDFIYIMDLGKDSLEDGTRFLACKGFQANGKMQGSKLTSVSKVEGADVRLSFSYSPIWGAMINNDINVSEISGFDLIKKGLVQEYTTESGSKSKRGLKRVYFNIEPVTDEDGEQTEEVVFEDNDGETYTRPVFFLTNAYFKNVEPLVEGQTAVEEENDDNAGEE